MRNPAYDGPMGILADYEFCDSEKPPAAQAVSIIASWMPKEAEVVSMSRKALAAQAEGYTQIVLAYGSDGYIYLQLRASDRHLMELQTIVAYPPKHGLGTKTISRICEVCDPLRVAIWCEVSPFGTIHEPPPINKLTEWYGRFGFNLIPRVSPDWLTAVHGPPSQATYMMREPKE